MSCTNWPYGQEAVGLNFNVTSNDGVKQCKEAIAFEIDKMNDLRSLSSSSEQKRICSIAITELQTAQMWAVKALTWNH